VHRAFEQRSSEAGVSEWRHNDNGLTVLIAPTAVAPVASLGVVYQVGSRNERPGHTGATHLLEHLMFKGTERFNRDRGTEAARVLQRIGARYNATTWLDRTTYFATASVEHLDLIAELEADRMRGARVRDEDLASERTVVLNELDRGENEPFDVLLKNAFAQVFQVHPYHHPTIGWRADVESVDGATLRGFYDTYYHPDNATVIITGDVSVEDALGVVERHFGSKPANGGPFPNEVPQEPDQQGERRFVVRRAGELGALCLSWRIPDGRHDDLPALNVATQILTEGVTSRLHQKLVETNRCLGVNAFALELRDPGLLQVVAMLGPDTEHEEVETTIRDEVADLIRNPPGDDEVARAVIQTRTDLAFHRESPAQMLSALTEAVALGDWRVFVREMDRTAAVTPADVTRAVAEHLVEDHLTAGWFVPTAGQGGAPVAVTLTPEPCYLHRPMAERIDHRRLPGGGRVAVLTNRHAPTATIAGTLPAGTSTAPDGRFSIPALTAAMLDRGTRSRSRFAMARELEDHGLQMGIQCGNGIPSAVLFTIQGLADEVPRMLDLLVDALRRPIFPEDEFETLRTRIAGALQHERDETFLQAFHALTRHAYPPGHPLRRRTVDRRLAELGEVSTVDLEAFHARVYGGEQAVFAVVGDVDADRVTTSLAEALGDWRSQGTVAPEVPPPLHPESARESIHLDDRPNLDLCLGHAGALLRGDEDYPAAVVANACLGLSTLTSRLGTRVRDTAGLTYGISSRFFGTLDIPGPWVVSVGVARENLERAEALTREVVEEFCAQGPTPEELEGERLSVSGSYRVGLATNSGVARELVTAMTVGGDVTWLDRYPQRVLEVSLEEVRAAVARTIHPERLIVTAAGTL
jgi:zinc protease